VWHVHEQIFIPYPWRKLAIISAIFFFFKSSSLKESISLYSGIFGVAQAVERLPRNHEGKFKSQYHTHKKVHTPMYPIKTSQQYSLNLHQRSY
jgi:hypothetical protein